MAPKSKRKTPRGPVQPRRSWLEDRAFELSKTCPVEHGNPVECPLSDLRRLDAGQRRKWIQRLTVEELEYLASYHACCSTVKSALAAR